MLLEICANSIQSALNAEQGAAHRIELCQQLQVGGITASAGLIEHCRKSISIGLNVLIRPRAGDFCYSPQELELMKADIRMAKALGADGIVSGLLLPNGKVDVQGTRMLVELAAPLPFTFHRAFDCCPDLLEALEAVIACGAHCILTSGGMPTAPEGQGMLARLIKQAGTRIDIMPGAGINRHNAAQLIQATNCQFIHSSAKQLLKQPNSEQIEMMGDIGDAYWETDTEEVKALRSIIEFIEKNN